MTKIAVFAFWRQTDRQTDKQTDEQMDSTDALSRSHRHEQRLNNKGKGLDTCYSTTYMSQTRDQQRFTISEVAADWYEPMVPQHIMWPSTARDNGQLDPQYS